MEERWRFLFHFCFVPFSAAVLICFFFFFMGSLLHFCLLNIMSSFNALSLSRFHAVLPSTSLLIGLYFSSSRHFHFHHVTSDSIIPSPHHWPYILILACCPFGDITSLLQLLLSYTNNGFFIRVFWGISFLYVFVCGENQYLRAAATWSGRVSRC